MNVNLTTWGLEKREKHQVHFELLRDTAVDGIIATDTDLMNSVIGEAESNSGMCRGSSDVDNFANDLIGIDPDRVESTEAGLLPRSLW